MKCPECEQPVQVGEEVVTTEGWNNKVSHRYHRECYDSLFISVPDDV